VKPTTIAATFIIVAASYCLGQIAQAQASQ